MTSFADHHDYAAHVGGASMSLVLTGGEKFHALLTQVDLPNTRLLRGEETLPRIGFRALTFRNDARRLSSPLSIAFDLGRRATGTRRHRFPRSRRTAACADDRALLLGHRIDRGRLLCCPPQGADRKSHCAARSRRIVRAPQHQVCHLRYLHSEACRLATTNPDMLAHPEACRSLEEDLLHALVSCFVTGRARERTAAQEAHAVIVVRFEDVLMARLDKKLRQTDVCAAIEVPERTLRASCMEVLGMSPTRYALLRRLNLVHAALRGTVPAGTVTEHARRYGFTELGRFAVAYRAAFGEPPSSTLRRARCETHPRASPVDAR